MITIDEQQTRAALQAMEDDPALITTSQFSIDKLAWPDNRIPFIEYHIRYLRVHKIANVSGYLSNLRIMLKKA